VYVHYVNGLIIVTLARSGDPIGRSWWRSRCRCLPRRWQNQTPAYEPDRPPWEPLPGRRCPGWPSGPTGARRPSVPA